MFGLFYQSILSEAKLLSCVLIVKTIWNVSVPYFFPFIYIYTRVCVCIYTYIRKYDIYIYDMSIFISALG